MAFSDNKITVADLTGKGVAGMADTPNLTTAQMQQKLDEIAKEVIPPKFNALCDDLDATNFASIITSKSTDKMLFQRLNEYDQIEYSVDNVNWFLVASGKEVLDPTLEADNSKKLGGQLPTYYQKTTDSALNTTDKTTTGAINEVKNALDNLSSDAVDINYDNTTSGLTATNVQDAIDEVNNSLTIHSTTFNNVASHLVGDYVINNESDILYLYKFTTAGTAITNATKVTGGVGVIANADGMTYVMGADSVLKKCSGGGFAIQSIKYVAEQANSPGFTDSIFNVADIINVNIGSITLLGNAPSIYSYAYYNVQGSNDANFATATYLIPQYTRVAATNVNLDVTQYDYIKIHMYVAHEGYGGYVLFENIAFS